MNKKIAVATIDALLPQTQCGLCGFGGCLPYATALSDGLAPINLCPPGGTATLFALGVLLAIDPQPFVKEMEAKAKPAYLAKIREPECIGCTKCIKACPVDAILGSAKKMHNVINDYCTGCELCIPACPVDCIDLIRVGPTFAPSLHEKIAAKHRYQQKESREAIELQLKSKKDITGDNKKNYLLAALARVKAKKK